MITPDRPELVMYADRIWFEYKEDIRNLADELNHSPRTYPGGEILKQLWFPWMKEQQIVFGCPYARIIDIIGSLVYLSEVKIGADLIQNQFFSHKYSQRVLLRAFGLYIE